MSRQTAAGQWVTGRGWIETFWKPPIFPTRSDLDKVSPDNPVFLTRADGHGVVVNSAALKIAGINKETPNPFGGEILKDKKSGEPTRDAVGSRRGIGPQTSAASDCGRNGGGTLARSETQSRAWLVRNPKRRERSRGSRSHPQALRRRQDQTENLQRCLWTWGTRRTSSRMEQSLNACDHHFTNRTIKVVFDGSLGSRSAALLDRMPTRRRRVFSRKRKRTCCRCSRRRLRRGVQVETHAIGDRANRMILDLYERALKSVPPNERKIREPRGGSSMRRFLARKTFHVSRNSA